MKGVCEYMSPAEVCVKGVCEYMPPAGFGCSLGVCTGFGCSPGVCTGAASDIRFAPHCGQVVAASSVDAPQKLQYFIIFSPFLYIL